MKNKLTLEEAKKAHVLAMLKEYSIRRKEAARMLQLS